MIKHIFSKENKALFAELVRTDFKLRYQGSVLGYTWSLLRPLLLFLILYLVFTQFIRLGDDVPNYPVYLLLGIVLWQFFADLTSQSLNSIVSRGDLIRKIKIPRWMIVLTSSVSALINLSMNLIIVFIFIALSSVELQLAALWLPFALIEIYILAVGFGLLLSAAFVKYRDISFIWELVLQAGFYVTPVIYPLSLVTNNDLQKILLMNPVAQAIQDARSVVITSETTTIAEVWGTSLSRVAPVALCILIFILGILYFKKESKYFAENL